MSLLLFLNKTLLLPLVSVKSMTCGLGLGVGGDIGINFVRVRVLLLVFDVMGNLTTLLMTGEVKEVLFLTN